MKKRILFVDDELKILKGLKRALYKKRAIWEMFFVNSGQEALDFLEENGVHVIVSDMRMPQMTGAELLNIVKDRYPWVVRIVLSGHSDINLVIKSVLPAHQFLSKPCEPDKLELVINRAMDLSSIINNKRVKALITRLDTIPTIPSLYQELVDELNKEEPELSRVGETIAADMAMSAKVLKLVNSSFFGISRKVTSPAQSVRMLGLNIIKALVLYEHIFTVYEDAPKEELFLQELWAHSLSCANLASLFSLQHNPQDKDMAATALIGGMLHDLGKMILACNFPREYKKVLSTAKESGRLLWDVETQLFGTTHAEVGAYLMGLWGLPQPVVEAIAFHHFPLAPTTEFRPVTAVYAANILEASSGYHDRTMVQQAVDFDYIGKLGLVENWKAWEKIARDVAGA